MKNEFDEKDENRLLVKLPDGRIVNTSFSNIIESSDLGKKSEKDNPGAY